MKVFKEEYKNFPDKCQTVINAVEGQALEDTDVFDDRKDDTLKEISRNVKLPVDGAPKAIKPKQVVVPNKLKESLHEDINADNAARIVQETIAHDFGIVVETATYKDADDAKCVVVEFIASKADCKKMPYDELKNSLYKRFGDDINISCKQFSSPNLKNKGTEYKLKLFILKEKKDKSKIYAESIDDAFTKKYAKKGQKFVNEDLIIQPIVEVENNTLGCVADSANKVMEAYQNANKWLDIIKEYLFSDLGCPFFASYIHNLAHTMPVRFDKFGDILHTIDMKIPYPATQYIPSEPQNIDDVFNLVFMILDAIKSNLNDFIKCTDDNYHGMSCAAETLLNDIEAEYTPLYKMRKAWTEYKEPMRFDRWVGTYAEKRSDLNESLKNKYNKQRQNMKVIKENLNNRYNYKSQRLESLAESYSETRFPDSLVEKVNKVFYYNQGSPDDPSNKILDTRFEDYYGDHYDCYIVECGNSNSFYLGQLIDDLKHVAEKNNFGFDYISNNNGFYGRTYIFSQFADESDSLPESLNEYTEANKLDLLQKVFGKELSQKQIDFIKDRWYGFYHNPEKYKGLVKYIIDDLQDLGNLSEGIYSDQYSNYGTGLWGSDPLSAREYSSFSDQSGTNGMQRQGYKDLPSMSQPIVTTTLSDEMVAKIGKVAEVADTDKAADIEQKKQIIIDYIADNYDLTIKSKDYGITWLPTKKAWEVMLFGTKDDLGAFINDNGVDATIRMTFSQDELDAAAAADKADDTDDDELTLIDLLDIELDADQGWSGQKKYRRIPTNQGQDDYAYTRFGRRNVVGNDSRYLSGEIDYTPDGNIKITATEMGRGQKQHTVDFAYQVADAYNDYGVKAVPDRDKNSGNTVKLIIPDEYKEKPIWDEEQQRRMELYADDYQAWKAEEQAQKDAKKAAKRAAKKADN